jgi:SAM-dependent methyltransferase
VSLTQEQVSRIERHLREQYRGVFDDRMLAAHISEYVDSGFADRLAAVIAAAGSEGDALLDVGAGYGAFVLACRRHGLDATGLELAAFEVEIARQRLAQAEPAADATTVFRQGDAGRLPFPDNTFEFVTLLNVLEHVPDYRAVLAEAARVLRPGGRLFVVCPNYAALRKEAHYHVPWLPLFPRGLAAAYLRLLGRNPGFFQQHVYYCTNWGVLRALRRIGLVAGNLDSLRLAHPELFGSRARRILDAVGKVRMLPLLKLAVRMNFYNPFKGSVTVVAERVRR